MSSESWTPLMCQRCASRQALHLRFFPGTADRFNITCRPCLVSDGVL